MRMRVPAVALLVMALTTLLGGQAGAAEPKQAGASVGSVHVSVAGVATTQSDLAPCKTPGENSTSGATPVAGVEFGAAKTSCTVDDKTGEATATASGDRFSMSLLRAHRGPLIKLTGWSVSCHTDGTGSAATMSLDGLSGVVVPSSIPVNYAVTVPGHDEGDPALARIVFNELVVPDPPDGSMTMNLMHITLFPDTPDSPDHGEVVLGTVNCAPSPW